MASLPKSGHIVYVCTYVYVNDRAVATGLASPVLAGPLFLKAMIKFHFTKGK